MSAALAEHFPDEEATIVPVMEHVLTQSEEKWFSKHGRAATPKPALRRKERRKETMTIKNTIADRDLEALRAALAGQVFVAGQAG